MSANTFGNIFKLTSFGESHGLALGGVIDGCPAGLKIDFDKINYELQRRKLIIKILNAPQTDPTKSICIENDTVKLKEYTGKKKWGGQRHNWWIYGIKNYWKKYNY